MTKHPNISKHNSKLGDQIPSLNMPVGRTCRPDAPCFAKCYARKGNFARPNVKAAHTANLEAYEADPDFFFHYISVMTRLSKYFRWHSSGDIVDERYLDGIVSVARENPSTNYLCFTKKFELVNAYLDKNGELPENLKIVFSAWGKDFIPENPHNLPIAYCELKGEDNSYLPCDCFPCGGKCYECVACWQLQKGQTVYFKEH